MKNDDILRKIKKCLRLAQGSNEHEAAAAIRQAQALMAKHGLSQDDVTVSDICEASARAGAITRPSTWETALCQTIAVAFQCHPIHSRRGNSAHWVFIGRDANPQIASHAFAQLYRQLKRARQAFIAETCHRVTVAQTKTKRADLFCRGWVTAIHRQVAAHAGTNPDAAAIDTYLAKSRSEIGELKPTDRHKGKQLSTAEHQAYLQGRQNGQAAQLHHGVNGAANQLALC